MIIPSFSLPSRPSKKISLREATVSDALDFCDSDPNQEEHLTTVFLNRVQHDPSLFIDSKTWTADDRRLGLYWYWLHTTDDAVTQLRYDCGHCGKKHSVSYDMRDLAEGYQQMVGLPEREATFNGETILIKPLSGSDMEAIEMLSLSSLSSDKDRMSRARVRLACLTRCVWFPGPVSKTDDDRISGNETRILALPYSEMRELSDLVDDKLSEMEHGLLTETDRGTGRIFLVVKTNCEETGGPTLLRVPFRDFVNIPMA